MSDINNQLVQLQQKLQLLIKNYQQLQREHVQLKKELEKTNTQLQEKNEHLQAIQQQIDVLKLGKAAFNEEEKLVLEKRINIYLKEIDKCLSLLND